MSALTKNKSPTDPAIAAPEIEWEVVTPERAKDFLATNLDRNRRLQRRLVRKYANNMQSGEWREVGDPLRFDKLGRLIDGQHRLYAVVESGVPQRFPIVRGLDPEDFHILDTGKARSPGDMLHVAGYTHTALIASAARQLITIADGPITLKTRGYTGHIEIMRMVERHPQLQNATHVPKSLRGVRPSLLVLFYYIGKHLTDYPQEAEAFVRVFNTGVPAYVNDPAHQWRERLLRDRADKRARATDAFSLLAMAHVWNLFVRRKAPVTPIRFPDEVEIIGLDISKI